MSDFLSDLGDSLAAVAPSIASAFGGPLAGLGVTWLEKALGVEPGASKDAKSFKDTLTSALANPDQVIKIREQDYAFKQFCIDHELQLEKIEAADRDSARNRQIQVKDHMPNVLCVMVTIGFFGMMGAMLHWDVPPQNKDMFNIMLGSLGTGWTACLAYFVGSNRGSKAKDETIATLSKPG